ncbi:MAG: hypothetical protein M0R80_08550 [Proteobacteria bacterium]|jgi:hypothetical protein|nr:hypothetical protein [Pseudomonadota bacterium]
MWQWLIKIWQKIQDLFVVVPKQQVMPTQITFQANDPTTPDLRFVVPCPSDPLPLQITVVGLNSPAEWGTAEGDAATVFVTLATLLEYLKKMFSKPTHWAAAPILQVVPRAGKQLNAYYDRQSLRYFFDQDRHGKMIYLCESSEVVAHECGHAILDALRPDFWSTASLETFAFHEAFADITAMVATMQWDQVLNKAIKDTNGNLHQSNVVSMIGEDVGLILGMQQGLRNAFNTFCYTPPENLPESAPDNQLSGECHNFGRVFLGAWYELMVNIYDYHKTVGMDAKTALTQARDVAYLLLLNAVVQTPNTPRLHEAIAKIMVSLASKDYQEIVRKTFAKRGLLGEHSLFAMSGVTWDQFADKDKARIIEGNTKFAVVSPEKKTMHLAHHVSNERLSALAIGGYNLGNVKVEFAADKFYEFDEGGKLISMFAPEQEELVQITQKAVTSITSIGPHEDTMWKVENGNLVRTYYE